VIFCADGDQGAWCMTRDGQIHQQSATPHLQVVDTLGAGDVFIAGVIDAMVRGHQPQEALTLATALAEKKILQYGIDQLFANDQRPVLAQAKEVTAHKVKVVSVAGRKHSVALFRHGEHIKAFDNNCPHADVPLDSMYKIEIDPRALTVKCSVHSALFRTDDGMCVSGPCERQSLKPTPISVDHQGWIYLAE
jgi:ketohexokinase